MKKELEFFNLNEESEASYSSKPVEKISFRVKFHTEGATNAKSNKKY